MKIERTRLPGVVIVVPRVFRDPRGSFMEAWNKERYAEAGLPSGFVQDNLSESGRGVLRGLHYQHPAAQGKLLQVLRGEIYDVAVDIRRGSPTFGEWVGVVLSGDDPRQLYVPEGFAHGFVVTSEAALFSYKCTNQYQPRDEGTVLWDDPDLGIEWPIADPLLSSKDRAGVRLREIAADRLPGFDPAAHGAGGGVAPSGRHESKQSMRTA
jgi:dTDP-4-dehydrorhamnose 3,5-epimerase